MTDFNLDQLGNPNAMMAGAAALTQDASSYTNTQDVEGTFVFLWKHQDFDKLSFCQEILDINTFFL